MGHYVITGAASGMGAAVAQSLRAEGDSVIGVDRDPGGAEVVADLSTEDGRRAAIRDVLDRCGGRLDGAVMAAGLGPARGRERTILEVNFLGVADLLTAFRPALAAGDRAKAVIIGSNSATTTPLVPRSALRRLDRRDTEGAARVIRRRPAALTGPLAYAASKIAVAHWCRRRAVAPEWAGAGIGVNLVAPGPVMTPLLRAQLDSDTGKNVRAFPVPVREYGRPEQIVDWVRLLLSPSADFMSGSVVTIDGGTEALLRPRAWPSPLPGSGVPRLLWRMYRAPKEGRVARY